MSRPVGNKKTRPPCYGCKSCVRQVDENFTTYYCNRVPSGYRVILYQNMTSVHTARRNYLEDLLKHRLRTKMRPLWCPEEKKGAHNNGNVDSYMV